MLRVENGLEIKIDSMTSSGGYISFKDTGINGGEITIEIKSLEYDGKSPRTDVRVSPKDLKRLLEIISAIT